MKLTLCNIMAVATVVTGQFACNHLAVGQMADWSFCGLVNSPTVNFVYLFIFDTYSLIVSNYIPLWPLADQQYMPFGAGHIITAPMVQYFLDLYLKSMYA